MWVFGTVAVSITRVHGLKRSPDPLLRHRGIESPNRIEQLSVLVVHLGQARIQFERASVLAIGLGRRKEQLE